MTLTLIAILLALTLPTSALAQRALLTADTTYYVSVAGSDANDCLTISTPCLTPQRVSNLIQATIDTGAYKAIVQFADNVSPAALYAGVFVTGRYTGGGRVVFRGNCTSLLNVRVGPPANGIAFFADSGAAFDVECLQITGNPTFALMAWKPGAHIRYGKVDFAAASAVHIYAKYFGFIEPSGNWTISGAAQNHVSMGHNAVWICAGAIGTVTASMAATMWLAADNRSDVTMTSGCAFALAGGVSVTGIPRHAQGCGSVQTLGANVPGNTGNTTDGLACSLVN